MNYQIILDETLKKIDSKKRLLLHACCAPCSSYVIEYLSKYFNITILYYNPNIDTKEEFEKRLSELKRFVKEFKTENPVRVISLGYNNLEYLDEIKGYEVEKEGGSRCYKCFKMRLTKSCLYAKENNFDYFTTTLTISPLKNSRVINEIGCELEKEYNMPYLYSDFKKREGYKRSIVLSHMYNLYRQNYCGCKFSKRERIVMNKKGFTLIELLAVIVLIALISAFVFPNINKLISNNYDKQFTTYEDMMISYAKSFPIKNYVNSSGEGYICLKTLNMKKITENMNCNGYVRISGNVFKSYLVCNENGEQKWKTAIDGNTNWSIPSDCEA